MSRRSRSRTKEEEDVGRNGEWTQMGDEEEDGEDEDGGAECKRWRKKDG